MQKEIKIEKMICIKAGNEDLRKLLLVCLSESVLVVDQNLKKRHKHATEAIIYNRQTSYDCIRVIGL